MTPDEHGDFDVLSGHHHAVVGKRLDTDASGVHDGLLEVALLLSEPEIDLEPRLLAELQTAQFGAQSPHLSESTEQRLERRRIAFGRKVLDGLLSRRGDA
jgi:hypothetical protein